jgi:hypothetical protein
VTRPSVRILYVPFSGKSEFREIANDLNSLFDLVGEGHLDMIQLNKSIVLFCDASLDEIGHGYNFTVNGRHVHGDAFFAHREGTSVVSLDDADLTFLLEFGNFSPAVREIA